MGYLGRWIDATMAPIEVDELKNEMKSGMVHKLLVDKAPADLS